MRLAFALIGSIALLAPLSIAGGGAYGKTNVSARRTPPSIARAKVRVVHREENVLLLPVVNQPDIHPDDQIFLDHILRLTPALCSEHIEQLVVRYPSTALRASDIERGQATATTMILRGPLASLPKKEQAEMIGVIFHECGHIIDLGALQGSSRAGESAYPDGSVPTFNDDPSRLFYEISWKSPLEPKEDARDEDFVSGYAKEGGAFEDPAESLVYFALHEQAFRERATSNPVLAKKLAWLENYVFKDGHSPVPNEGWDGTIAWDVTKLAISFAF